MKTRSVLKMIFFVFLVGFIVLPAYGGDGSSTRNQGPFGAAAPDLYWLSYVENGKGVFLMQIDSIGNVIRAPVFLGEFGPAISRNGPNTINLWGSKRAVINKKTLSLVKKINNPIGSPHSITNKTQNNFITIGGEEPVSLKFFGVSPAGIRNGETWEIASSKKGFCGYVICPPGAVSSDGKAVFWIVREFFDPTGLYIQLLSDTGRPDGFQRLVSQDDAATGLAVSNLLPEGKIYLVYQRFQDGWPFQLILQAVDVQTGQKIGEKIILKNGQFYYDSVAIDPLGRFVIYGSQNKQKVHFLSFLALDGTGHPSGTPKVLVRNVDGYDIHLLRD